MKKPLPSFNKLFKTSKSLIGAALILLLLTSINLKSHAQLFYVQNDQAATANDRYMVAPYAGGTPTTISTGNIVGAIRFAVDGNNNRLFAIEASGTSGVMKVINLSTGALIRTITSPRMMRSVQYDAASDYLYYSTEGTGTNPNAEITADDAIYRVHPDGTGLETVATNICENIYRFFLDLSHNQIVVYQSNYAKRQIITINIANPAAPVIARRSFAISYVYIWDVAYNPSTSQIYYMVEGGNGSASTAGDFLARQNLDGTGNTVLITNFLYNPMDMVGDWGNNRLFVSDPYALQAKIVSVDLSNNTYATVPITLPKDGSFVVQQLAVPDPPTVTTASASLVSSTSTTLGGNLTLGYGLNTERGVVYSTTNQTPTISDSKAIMATGTNKAPYSASVTGLSPTTTYYARAYAINGAGTTYGTVISFTTLSNNANLSAYTLSSGTLSPSFAVGTTSYAVSLPNSVSTLSVTPTKSHAAASIKVNGNVVNSGSASGNVNLNAGPNTINTVVTAQDGTTAITYALTATRRADPTLTTAAVTGITASGATLAGNVSADGYGAITEKGMVIATHSTPTTADRKLTAGTTGTGTVSANLTDLTVATTYYVRTYAINLDGTFYGNEISFKTTHTLDKVGLTAATPPATAYSLRLLSTTYTGKAINVRRGDNNATSDIGFTTDGQLDTATLKTFVGNATAFVTKWYDQSGNGYDLSQTATSYQPRIVTNGVVDRLNGRPSVYFDNANNLTTVKAIIFPTATSIVAFASGKGGNAAGLLTKTGTANDANLNYPAPFDITNSSAQMYVGNASTQQGNQITANTNSPRFDITAAVKASVYSFIIPSSGTYDVFLNGTKVASNTVAGYEDGGNKLMMGSRNNLETQGNFWTPEAITFNSVISTTARQAIENSEKNYFSSSDADLTGLAFSAGTLSPTFNASTLTYTLTISGETTAIKVTPSRTQAGGTIKVNNLAVPAGTASADISLAPGQTVITIAVTAQDGTTTKSYTVTVNRTNVPQTITFAPIGTKPYNTADFAPGATSTSGLAVSYSSANTEVATIVNNQIHIVGLGTSVITATQAGNGTYAAATSTTQTLTVSAATITITATAQTKVYGNADPTFTYTATGVLGNDVATGTLARATGSNVGEYAITLGSLSYGDKYIVNYVSANLTITKRPFTIKPINMTKVYGNADEYFIQYSQEGSSLAPGDGTSGGFSRLPGENVGSYATTIGEKRILDPNTGDVLNNNYNITFIPSTYTITPKPITVTANAATKGFGEADPIFTYAPPADITDATFTGSLSRAVGEELGIYAITIGNLQINSNYTFSLISNNLTIGAKNLMVTANAATKVYGNEDPIYTFTPNVPIVGNSTFTGAPTREEGKNVGTYAINGLGTLALDNPRYTLSFATGGILTITKRPLIFHPVPATKMYGNPDPSMPYQLDGTSVAPGEGITGIFGRPAGENVGTYALTLGTKRPVVINTGEFTWDNYDVSFVSNNLTITPRPINILARAATKIYGDEDPVFSTDITGNTLVENDALTGSMLRVAGENVGTYAINQGTLSPGSNYSFTFTSENLTIGKKEINVIADAKSKTFGGTDPALTYTATALKSGDNFSGALTRTAGENFGTYPIIQGTLALSNNYVLNFTGANFNIGTKTINVTANAKSKTYGNADPTFDYVADALSGSDTFSGSLTRASGENAGNHAIQIGTLAASGNYTINYTGANLNIGKATLTYTANPATRYFKVANPTFTGSVTGFVNGETLANATTGSLLFSSTATLSSPQGIYPINGSGLTASNYNLVQNATNATALSITASGDNTLSGLTVTQGTLDPIFSSSQTTYSFSVAHTITAFNLVAALNSELATITINNVAYTSGTTKTLPLLAGSNQFNITVTAQDESTKTYTLFVNRALSTNNLLSSFSIPGVTLVPAFDPAITSYKATVAHTVASIDLYGIAADTTAVVNGNNGPNSPTNPLTWALSVGEYSYNLEVAAQSGAKRYYSVLINRLPSADASLASFGNSDITLNTPIVAGTLNYTTTVAHEVEQLSFIPTAVSDQATITVNGQPRNIYSGNTMPIGFGENILAVQVTSADGNNVKTYNLTITRARSANARLGTLTIPFTTSLNESFDPDVYAYTANLADSTITGLPFTAYSENPYATLKVNGTVVPRFQNYFMALHGGANTFNMVVTSQDGTQTKTYTLVLTRAGQAPPAQSPIARLASLTITSAGSFSKNFNLAYEELTTVTTPYNVTSVRLFLNKEHPNATLTLNGAAYTEALNADDLYPIAIGDNVFTVVVTAEDGVAKQTYLIHVNRLPYVNVDLAALSINKGSLSPIFSSATTTYAVTVPYTASTLTLTPRAATPGSTIEIAGQYITPTSLSATVDLYTGIPNRIRVNVKAADGVNAKTYIVTVTREQPSANLSNLLLSSGTFNPVFNPASETLTASVSNATASINLTPTPEDPNATIKINGTPITSGTASTAIALNVGSNQISILVTLENGTNKTYVLTIIRQTPIASNVATLTSLNLDQNIKKTASTGASDYNYKALIPNTITSINVTPIATNENATIEINGVQAISGMPFLVTLTGPTNTINVTVTAENEISKKTYTIQVENIVSSNALLSTLNLDQNIKKTTTTGLSDFDYKASVPSNITSVNVTPVAANSNSSILINGLPALSGQPFLVQLNELNTIINVIVTAEDGTSVKTYAIDIAKNLSSNALLSALTIDQNIKKTTITGSNDFDYKASVPSSFTSINVTPIASDPNAIIKINGSTAISGMPFLVPLVGNTSIINISVTAENGFTVKTYAIQVNKIVSSNALLSVLNLDQNIKKTLIAGSSDFNYNATTASKTTSVNVTAVASGVNSSISINGSPVTSGSPYSVAISGPTTIIDVVVVAEDGVTTKNYTIYLNKLISSNASLNLLTLDQNIKKTLTTGSSDFNYKASAPATSQSVNITAATTDPNANFTINGVSANSGLPFNLVLTGSTTIANITVTAEDGTTIKVYSIIISKPNIQTARTSPDIKETAAPLLTNKTYPTELTPLVVRQALSPNGDGVNDVLVVEGITAFPDNQLSIMNRAGAIIFQTKGYDNSNKVFDGHATNGTLQAPGTYFYTLEYKDHNTSKRKTGYLIIKY